MKRFKSNRPRRAVKPQALQESAPADLGEMMENWPRGLGLYTLVFIFTAVVYFLPLLVGERTLIWYLDGTYQHYAAYLYYGDYLRDFFANLFRGSPTIPMYDFSLGFGSDSLATLSYYAVGDPLCLLTVFVPDELMEGFYCGLIVARLYLAGLFFLLFCRKFRCPWSGAAAGAMLYVFATYTLANTCKHPYFANPMIYLPLLLLGVERLYSKRKPALFIWMVAIAGASNFYFFYMLVVEVVVYASVRYFYYCPEDRRKNLLPWVGRFLACGLIGVLMACILLVPSVVALATSERSSLSAEFRFSLFYVADYYRQLWLGIISDMTVGRYTQDSGAYTYLGFGSFFIPALGVLWGTRDRSLLRLKVICGISTACLLCFLAGRALNGFAYAANRWAFAWNLLAGFLVAYLWPRLTAPDRRTFLSSLTATGIYLLGCFLLREEISSERWFVSLAMLLAAQLFLLVLFLARSLPQGSTAVAALALTLVVAGQGLIGCQRFRPEFGYLKEFLLPGQALERSIGVPAMLAAALQEGDPSFWRFGTSTDWDTGTNHGESDERLPVNGAMLTGTRGCSYYFSLINGNGEHLLQKQLGLEGNTSAYFGSCGPRSAIQSFCGVRYYIQPEGYETSVPSLFTLRDIITVGKGSWQVWENDAALPFGVLYDTEISQDTMEALEPVACEQTLLVTASVPEEQRRLPEGTPLLPQEIPYTITHQNGVTIHPDGIMAEKGGTIHLAFDGLSGCETYLQITGLEPGPQEARDGETGKDRAPDYVTIYVTADGGTQQSQVISCPEYLWYSGKKDFVWPLVSENQSETGLAITFAHGGWYPFDEMKVLCYETEAIRQAAQKRGEQAMEDLAFFSNGVFGTVETDAEALLQVSIPYFPGWSALLDGKPVEIFPCNTMMTGLYIPAGKHTVELRYRTPGLAQGAILSGIGCAIFLILTVEQRRQERRERRREERRERSAERRLERELERNKSSSEFD